MLTPQQFGAKGDGTTDDTAAFESLFADAKAYLAKRPAVAIHIPEADYRIEQGPLFVPDGCNIRGDGWSSRLMAQGMTCYPALVCGVPDPSLTLGDRPGLFGVLDSTAVSTAGQRWGFSTAGGCHLQLQQHAAYGPFAATGLPSYFRGQSVLTLDLKFAVPPSGLARPILGQGLSCDRAIPRPWAVQTHPELLNWWTIWLCTDACPGEEARADVRIDVAIPWTAKEVSLQLDLAAGRFDAWADRKLVETRLRSPALGWPRSLRVSYDWPLMIGSSGQGPVQAPTPFTLAGCWWGSQARYVPGSNPQARLDGQPMVDLIRYFDRTAPGTIGLIPFTDPPTRRWLTVLDGRGMPGAALIGRGAPSGGAAVRLSDLGVISRGPSILLGSALDFLADNCLIESGGGTAVGSVSGQVSYPVLLSRCRLNGQGDAAVRVDCQLLKIVDCFIGAYASHAIMSRGSALSIVRCFVGDSGQAAEAIVCYAPGDDPAGCAVHIDELSCDTESGAPTRAIVLATQPPVAPLSVRIDDLFAATAGGRPPIVLVAWPGARCMARYRVGWTFTGDAWDVATVVADPAGWVGDTRD